MMPIYRMILPFTWFRWQNEKYKYKDLECADRTWQKLKGARKDLRITTGCKLS